VKDPLERNLLRKRVAERMDIEESALPYYGPSGRRGAAAPAAAGSPSAPPDGRTTAERKLLALMLADPLWVDLVAKDLAPESMNPVNRRIYEAILDLAGGGKLARGQRGGGGGEGSEGHRFTDLLSRLDEEAKAVAINFDGLLEQGADQEEEFRGCLRTIRDSDRRRAKDRMAREIAQAESLGQVELVNDKLREYSKLLATAQEKE
jgi:hypothetical protein